MIGSVWFLSNFNEEGTSRTHLTPVEDGPAIHEDFTYTSQKRSALGVSERERENCSRSRVHLTAVLLLESVIERKDNKVMLKQNVGFRVR